MQGKSKKIKVVKWLATLLEVMAYGYLAFLGIVVLLGVLWVYDI